MTGRKPGVKSTVWTRRNIQPEQNEEQEFKKNEERLRNLQDIFKHSNIRTIGVPEEKRKSKKSKTYLKT